MIHSASPTVGIDLYRLWTYNIISILLLSVDEKDHIISPQG